MFGNNQFDFNWMGGMQSDPMTMQGFDFTKGFIDGNTGRSYGMNGKGQFTPQNLELGMNIPTMQLALGGLQSIGNLWGAYNSNKLANKQLNFTMDAYNQNVAMQKKTHNTALEDRTRARGKFEGHSQEYMDDYNRKNRL